jgi:hypothetical protein
MWRNINGVMAMAMNGVMAAKAEWRSSAKISISNLAKWRNGENRRWQYRSNENNGNGIGENEKRMASIWQLAIENSQQWRGSAA